MLFSQVKGRRVVGIETAETIATVTACAISPSPPAVTAFRVRGRTHGKALVWDDVESFGTDAVTVRSPDMVRPDKNVPDGQAYQRRDPIGKQVLTETGEALGTVQDIEFDEASGRIRRLVTTGEEIPAGRLVGVGGYAVVVEAR